MVSPDFPQNTYPEQDVMAVVSGGMAVKELAGLGLRAAAGAIGRGAVKEVAESAVEEVAIAAESAASRLNILNPSFTPDAGKVLQNATTYWNSELAADPSLARTVLSPKEYIAAQRSARVARMAYGNAVERLVARDLSDSMSSQLFRYTGGPRGGSMPDFIDLSTGRFMDITTPGQVASKAGKWYGGPRLVTPTYTRPAGFTVFP